MQADQLLEIILYFICAWAGMIIGFLLVLYTVVVRKFRKPPGMLILWAIVSIMIFFSSIFVYAVYELWDWVMWHITWNFFGMLWTYAAILGSSYILASWIEVYTKVKEPLNMQYYKRSIYYHISWQSLAIVIALVGFLWDQYGAFHHGICFVKHDSLFQVVFFIPVICNIAAWTLLLMGLRIMDSQTQYLWRHMIFCFCFLALTIFAVILIWIILLAEDEDYKIVGRIFNYGVSVGYLWIMIYRFIDIIQYHKKWRVTQEQLRRNMWAPLRQISFFTDVFIEGVQDSMQALSFVFGRITPELISLEKRATYREKRNWNFDPRTSTFVSDGELSHASSSTWRTNARTLNVIEYAPALFAKIRATDQISAEYLSEILKPQDNISSVMENAINKGGRGGSFFYFTPDKRFIIKSLINTEKSVLCGKFLNDYSSTLDCWLLSRVYGIFKITVGGKKPICVMIMGSVIPPEAKIIAQFDIKGSRKDRYILSFHQENYSIGDLHESKIYKDQDFDEAIGEIKLPMANSIKEQLRKDSRLLASYNLMDYSVLIWVTEPIQNINSRFLFQSERYSYCIAIIDYLQEYTIAKRLERVGKAITSKAKHLSVMNPKDYVKRFNEKIENIIKDIN